MRSKKSNGGFRGGLVEFKNAIVENLRGDCVNGEMGFSLYIEDDGERASEQCQGEKTSLIISP